MWTDNSVFVHHPQIQLLFFQNNNTKIIIINL